MALPTNFEFDFEEQTEEITAFGYPWHGSWNGSYDPLYVEMLTTNIGPVVDWKAEYKPQPEMPKTGSPVARQHGSVRITRSPTAVLPEMKSEETAEGMQLIDIAIYSGKNNILYGQEMINSWIYIDNDNKAWKVDISGSNLMLTEFGIFDNPPVTPITSSCVISGHIALHTTIEDWTERGDKALFSWWIKEPMKQGKDGLMLTFDRRKYTRVAELVITGSPTTNNLTAAMTTLKVGVQLDEVVEILPSLPPVNLVFSMWQYKAKSYRPVEVTLDQYDVVIDSKWEWIIGGVAMPSGLLCHWPDDEAFGLPQEITTAEIIGGGHYGAGAIQPIYTQPGYMTTEWIPVKNRPNNPAQFTYEHLWSHEKWCEPYMTAGSKVNFTTQSGGGGWRRYNEYVGCHYSQSNQVIHVTFEIEYRSFSEKVPDQTFRYSEPHTYASSSAYTDIGNFTAGIYFGSSPPIQDQSSVLRTTAKLFKNGGVVSSVVQEAKNTYATDPIVNLSTNTRTWSATTITDTNTGYVAMPMQYSNTLYGLFGISSNSPNLTWTWGPVIGKWADITGDVVSIDHWQHASENPFELVAVRSNTPICFM